MEDNYANACSEVLAIISILDKEISNKIPPRFIELLSKISNKDYVVTIEKNKGIKEQNILKETKLILALIYRDYICSEKERQKIMENELILKKEMLDKYNPNNLFNKTKVFAQEEIEEKQLIEVKDKSIIMKIIDKIKSLFVDK